jgi:hypothetical protein
VIKCQNCGAKPSDEPGNVHLVRTNPKGIPGKWICAKGTGCQAPKFQLAEDDPNVIAALREGRASSDIWLVQCEVCGTASYYNEGSHASCFSCGADLSNLTDEAFTLWDYWEYEPYPVDDSRRSRK